MVTRVKVKPDADGKIRVVCGNDIIEIDPSDDVGDFFGPNDVAVNPVDQSHTFFRLDEQALTRERIDAIVRDLTTMKADPGYPDPRTVVVQSSMGLDVHATTELSNRLFEALPDAMLGFDLRELNLK